MAEKIGRLTTVGYANSKIFFIFCVKYILMFLNSQISLCHYIIYLLPQLSNYLNEKVSNARPLFKMKTIYMYDKAMY